MQLKRHCRKRIPRPRPVLVDLLATTRWSIARSQKQRTNPQIHYLGVSPGEYSTSVNGRQFVAIGSGGGSVADGLIATFWPETKDKQPQSAATLFVFALVNDK